MADLRLAAIDPIRTTAGAVWADGRNGAGTNPRSPRKQSAKERLVRALAPGRPVETCEVDYVVDGNGMMVAILVRDVSNGEVVARIEAQDLWQLGAAEVTGGMLLERKG